MTVGDIKVNDGNSVKSIIHNKIRTRYNAEFNVDFYKNAYAIAQKNTREIWFCIPENSEYPDIAYIYNWEEDSWCIRDLPANLGGLGFGSRPDLGATPSWESYTADSPWDNQNTTWGGNDENSPFDDSLIGVNITDSSLIDVDPKASTEASYDTIIERLEYPLVDDRQVTTITRVYPHIKGNEEIEVQFGSQDFAGADVRWKPAVTFNPTTDRKIDIRTTGEYHCWRYSSSGKSTWVISGMNIEFELAGLR